MSPGKLYAAPALLKTMEDQLPITCNPPTKSPVTPAEIANLEKTLGEDLFKQMKFDPKLDFSHCKVIEGPNTLQLRQQNYWVVAVPTIAPPHTFSHLFMVVGDPGKGDKSGILYLSISSDTNRGTVSLDEIMDTATAWVEKDLAIAANVLDALEKLPEKSYASRTEFHVAYENARKSSGISSGAIKEEIKKIDTLVRGAMKDGRLDVEGSMAKARELMFNDVFNEQGMLKTLKDLPEKSYSSREQFNLAYESARKSSGLSHQAIQDEIKKLYTLVPNSRMELWIRESNGRTAINPNLAERDTRSVAGFEGFRNLSEAEILSGKTIETPVMNIRRVETPLNPFIMLEAKRAFIAARMYIDALHNRDGSGIPLEDAPEKYVSAEALASVAEHMATYKYVPDFDVREGAVPLPDGTLPVKSANCGGGTNHLAWIGGIEMHSPSPAGYGVGAELRFGNTDHAQIWPTPSEPNNNLHIGQIDTTALNQRLIKQAAIIAATPKPEKTIAETPKQAKL